MRAKPTHTRRKGPVTHSRCVQVRVQDVCREALSVLSTKGKQGEIPLVLIPSLRPTFSLMMSVPDGVFCLGQRFGRDIGVINPGLAIKPSFIRISHVVSKQSCTYDAPVKLCPTSDDVRVNIDVVVILQITNPQPFIYKLGARNFDEFLSGTVDEGIRMLVRGETHRTVYDLRGDKAQVLLQILNDKFDKLGVRFSDVKITSVELPDELSECLEITTKMAKAMEKLTRQNEFEMMQIQQESEMTIEEIKRKSEQVVVTEAGRKRREELKFEQASVETEMDGKVALIEAQTVCDVKNLETRAQLNRTKKQLETWRIAELSRANANATKVKVGAERESEEALIEGSWQEEQMICEAEATKHEAAAEADASSCLIEKRKHELDMREKDILMRLSAAGNFNLIGTTGDSLVNALMTGSFSQKQK